MNTTEVTSNDLCLWDTCFSIRMLIQRQSFSKLDFQGSETETLLVSAVESVYLTDGMLTTFLKTDPPINHFARCLWHWGAIQALVVQQDAVKLIGKSLQKTKSDLQCLFNTPLMTEIRELRNRSVGHPTVDDGNKRTSKRFSFPASHSGKQYSFLLLDNNTDPPTFQPQDVDVEKLIIDQRDVLLNVVKNWRQKLVDEENLFREGNRLPTLESSLSNSLFAYHLSNMLPESNKLHLNSAQSLKDILDGFAEHFRLKGAFHDNSKDIIESMKYPIVELVQFYSRESHLTQNDISVFIDALHAKFYELIAIAKEIDAEYSKRLV